jgi:hypothetical protein
MTVPDWRWASGESGSSSLALWGTEKVDLRRTAPFQGREKIAAYLRGASGQLTAVLAAPDSRSVSIRRTLR